MSHHTTTTHTAGGLEGLALGAPIGGGSSNVGAGSGLISSSTTGTGVGSGLTGSSHEHGSGLTGSNTTGTGIGSGLTGSSHQHGTGIGSGLTGSSTTGTGSSAYDSGAANSTSGERGIGGGRGGPTAFEQDASRVGTTGGAGDHGHIGHQHGHSHGTGITGPTGTGAGDDKAAIKALTGAGHHDQSRVGQYDSGATTGSHGHGHGLAATAAATGAGVGAAGLASHSHRGGEVDDSVTGQEHFKSRVGEQTAGDVGRASTLTSSGAGAGTGLGHGSSATSTGAPVASGGAGYGAGTLAGVGAAGAGAAAVGAGAHGHSHGNNPVKELKQELKEHQSAPGYDKAEHHTETEGPHGLVWHNGKYVHKRELEGKGSTGVPLK